MDAYVSLKIETTNKLASIGLTVPDEWLTYLLLAGLPKKHLPIIMTIQGTNEPLKSELVKAEIIQHVRWNTSSSENYHNKEEPSSYYTSRHRSHGPKFWAKSNMIDIKVETTTEEMISIH